MCWCITYFQLPSSVNLFVPGLSLSALSFALNSLVDVDVASIFGKNQNASDFVEIPTPSPVDSFF